MGLHGPLRDPSSASASGRRGLPPPPPKDPNRSISPRRTLPRAPMCRKQLQMAAVLRRTTTPKSAAAAAAAAAALFLHPHSADRLARSLCAGASAACSDAGAASAAEFVPWRNGGGNLHRAASVDPTAVVEAGAVVHSGAVLGKEVVVGSGTVVGPWVSVGQSTRIGYNVVLSNCSVGEFCTIHNGACIGQDGFGFFMDEYGQVKKKPQELYARIGDNVEIGANTCIDRGSWRDTVIGDDTKIDNLVQIGHNVVIGKCCMICGQVGIAGSATLGDYVTLGGRVAIRDHVSIASKVRLAANSLVTKDIQKPGDYGGFPAVPVNEWRRQTVNLRLFSKRHGDRR